METQGQARREGRGGEPGQGARKETRQEKDEQPKPATKTRFFGTKELSPEKYALDFQKITAEVLTHRLPPPA